jgi:hypothetical protein
MEDIKREVLLVGAGVALGYLAARTIATSGGRSNAFGNGAAAAAVGLVKEPQYPLARPLRFQPSVAVGGVEEASTIADAGDSEW